MFKYTRPLLIIILLGCLTGSETLAQVKIQLTARSPDKKTVVMLGINDRSQLMYRVDFNNNTVVNWSGMGLLTDKKNFATGIEVLKKEQRKQDLSFTWLLGEDEKIENKYRLLILHCRSSNAMLDIVGRVYNGSFAFKYVCKDLTDEKPTRLIKELTEFNLNNSYSIYQYHEESIFRAMPLDSLSGTSDLPSTLVSGNNSFVSIGEAENRNYTKCVLVKGQMSNSLALNFYTDTLYRNGVVDKINKDTLVVFKNSLITPWRTISISNTAIGLHAFSQLNLKLTEPDGNVSTVAIKPGKVFRVPISTQGGLDGADFAAKHHFQYIMLDAGWYGAEFRTTSDPTQPIPGLDLPGIIKHATSKGIGVILYVNYVGLKAKLDTILPLFKKWGVSGIKFGFVDGGTQKGLTWLDSAMQKVNDFGFVLNVHDHYKPTGLSRRYPYVLSQEGIRGDENSPDAFHNTVLPFTRYLAGPADFTFCFPNSRDSFSKNIKVSKGQQLALTVVYFDPLQAIFWYGKSADYTNDEELAFFDQVPTVWDESRYLAGDIGKGVCVARKKNGSWYIGAAAGLDPWRAKIDFDFLDKGKSYLATIYEDDGKKGIEVSQKEVKRGANWLIDLPGKEGQAIILTPR